MKSLAVSLSLAAFLVATTPVLAQDSAPTTHAETAKPKANKKRLFKAGGIGCLTGALGGLLVGKKKEAIAGCVIGGAVGSVASYRKQMDEARQLQQEAQSAGMTATVATKEATAKSGEKVEALDSVVIAYDPASMSARDPKTIAVLEKIATLAKKSKEPLTITVEGRDQKACQIPLAELSARDAFPPATAVDHCGKGKAQIVITPVPDVSA